VRAKWGVDPASIADFLALVGDSSDGYPGLAGWGAATAATVLARYGSVAAIPGQTSEWEVTVRGAPALAARLAEGTREVDLYLTLARLRTDVPLPQREPEELRWRGAPRAAYQAFCDELGLAGLRNRPHRWSEG